MKLDGKKIIEELDLLFSKNEVEKAGELLYKYLKLSKEYNDTAAQITVLNELVGFHRRTGKKDEALAVVKAAVSLVENEGLPNITRANTYLNCATTLKGYDSPHSALPLYEKAYLLYKSAIPETDYRFAAFYNNYALALADVGRFFEPEELYEKALGVLRSLGGNSSEIAVTYCNMAFLFDKTGADEKASNCLDKAYEELLGENTVRDGYYAFNCEKCADAFKYFGRFSQQWELEKTAEELYENNRAE